MSSELETAQWLQEQPLDEPITIDGESVYLQVHPDGAELGAHLMYSHTQEQLQRALQQGFSSALEFDAGVGLGADGNSLVLTQWLPNVRDWSQAAKPLENLLNQIATWRAALSSPEVAVHTDNKLNRTEQRLRMLLMQNR